MGRPHAALLTLAAIVAVVPLSSRPRDRALEPRNHERYEQPALEIGDDPNQQAEMEFLMLRDPRTNAIPPDIRRREMAFARTLPDRAAWRRQRRMEGATAPQALTWIERGPNNVGGRTRAFAIDVANASTLIAGSVAGGIWKSTNDGGSWSLRSALPQIHGTTCIAQDRRVGKRNVWYVGTGEIRGSTTNDTRWGSLYRGDGIFKSTDNGDTWTLLPSTKSGTPQTTDNFDFVIDVATDPSAPAHEDEVYAATYNGIYRSTDGGGTWTTALSSDSGYTDVAVTSAGVTYACTRNPSPRVWRSPDGVSWTNIVPVGFPTAAGRIVIGLAPSNPNVVYFFVQDGRNPPTSPVHQLWKYTYVSGNGSGAGGTWQNRAGNLPGDINTQGGYDQIVHVKPDDENFVIIGGTNLYRSTDGFASLAATTVIGGYPYWPDGNHHPDLHAGAFSPANPNAYYSAGDGGVSKAADVRIAEPMLWTSLNHGYNVTQFYSVSIAPEGGSHLMMAGAQDNGTQLGNAPGASDWIMAYGGDGTVVEVAPLADDRLYTQYQNGQMQRQSRSGADLTNITPVGAVNMLFVNPILLDHTNSARLYYPGGISSTSSRIWRNDLAPLATDITGWSQLASTEVGAGVGYARRISALGLSTQNDGNVLWYGTVDGLVFRADGADLPSPVVTDVTPPGLNGGTAAGGFVRCIAVDPTSSNRALVAFGNYSFPSLWYTTDGGATWTDVEGNLSGPSGPSIRWASIFYASGSPQIFLGTSIGVLSTTALAGGSTTWIQEAGDAIGNVLIATMDYRPADRTLAVATHGRGVFTTQFLPAADVAGDVAPSRVMLSQSRPNPARDAATIAYELPRAGRVSLRVYDAAGREVATLVDGWRGHGRHEARFTAGRLPPGTYHYVLRTDAGVETRKLSLVR
jgi:hypothetical protein